MADLNLSKFKKISSDKNCTVLKHDDGHELKVAHSVLSPKLRKEINKLPVHAAEGMAIDDSQGGGGAPEERDPAAAPDMGVPPEQDVAAPVAPEKDPREQAYENYKAEHAKEYGEQDAAFDQDLKNGHVTPKTYADLFADKSTLGKIGTMFGLLVSGAGSGLAHQPNAVLSMMDQQIKNDLSAQMQSKTNAQNFIKLNMQQQLQTQNIENLKKQGKLTDKQAESMEFDVKQKSYNLANMQMNRAALHSMAQTIQKMPQGPQRQQAMQTLAMMYQAVNSENYSIADRAASAQALTSLGNENQANPEQGFQQQNTALRVSGNAPLAENREAKHFPGIQGQASGNLGGQDREYLNGGIRFQKQLDDFYDWSSKHSGSLSPSEIKEGQAKAADLQGAYRQATHGGVYKEGEQNFISKLIDEKPTRFFNSIRVLPSLKALSDDNKTRVDQYAKNLGFNGYSAPSGQGSAGGDTIERIDPKSGKTVVFDAKTKKPLRWK